MKLFSYMDNPKEFIDLTKEEQPSAPHTIAAFSPKENPTLH